MRAKWGQNFLVDLNWQRKIVESFSPAGAFGEIGPGRGALTTHLEKAYKDFVVFEIDHEIIPLHENKERYTVIPGSFLDWDYKLKGEPVKKFSLIGNLPYETGSAMLQKVAEHSDQIEHFVFLLQKEVVDRVAALPETRDFGFLTVKIQGQFDLKKLDQIPAGAFSPPPKVSSQLLMGQVRAVPHSFSKEYESFLKIAFAQKRKALKNNLKAHYSTEVVERAFESCRLSSLQRAEEVKIDIWPDLFRALSEKKNGGE